jgi:hypothetical protein
MKKLVCDLKEEKPLDGWEHKFVDRLITVSCEYWSRVGNPDKSFTFKYKQKLLTRLINKYTSFLRSRKKAN